MLKRLILVKKLLAEAELENRAWITLKECLEAIPGANVVVYESDHADSHRVSVPDLVASVNIEGRQTRLIAEVKREVCSKRFHAYCNMYVPLFPTEKIFALALYNVLLLILFSK